MSHASFSLPEEIIHEVRNGRMFLLADDGDRENEGDLFVPAPMTKPDAVNVVARHGRGLICFAMAELLGLDPMAHNHGTRHEAGFAAAIEAHEGKTTGSSAAAFTLVTNRQRRTRD